MTRLAGLVLCGGRSSRMGQPKEWLPFASEPLLRIVVRRLMEAASPIVVVAAPGQVLPELPACVERVDDPVAHRGPLQGLAVGLASLSGRADAAYVSACDTPFVTPAWIRFLADRLGDAAICVPEAAGYRHPLAAVYRVEVALAAADLLAHHLFRPAFLMDRLPTQVIAEKELRIVDASLGPLRNLNTPGDYEAALRDWQSRSLAGEI